MSNNRLEWTGLDELRSALMKLPEEFGHEGAEMIDDTTEVTAASLIQSYPLGDTGNLRKGVKHTVTRDRFGAVGQVKSTSPHSHLWEWGTQSRQTRKGWKRGKAPSHKPDGLVPIAQRERRKLNIKLLELVRRAGFEISGTL
jgi:hypothetical protein